MTVPNFRDVSWLTLVTEADKELYATDPAYKFSNDREFVSSDKGTSGIYSSSTQLEGLDGEQLVGLDGEILSGLDQ